MLPWVCWASHASQATRPANTWPRLLSMITSYRPILLHSMQLIRWQSPSACVHTLFYTRTLRPILVWLYLTSVISAHGKYCFRNLLHDVNPQGGHAWHASSAASSWSIDVLSGSQACRSPWASSHQARPDTCMTSTAGATWHTFLILDRALQRQNSCSEASKGQDLNADTWLHSRMHFSARGATLLTLFLSVIAQAQSSSDFVNRESEQSLLRKYLNSKPAHVLVIVGPRSSGKTRLLEKVLLKGGAGA